MGWVGEDLSCVMGGNGLEYEKMCNYFINYVFKIGKIDAARGRSSTY